MNIKITKNKINIITNTNTKNKKAIYDNNKNDYCHNNNCNVMVFLKDYITPIFQVLTVELPEYHMNLRTTKCLNTSVMTMFLLLGNKGLKKSEYCSVQNIRKRVNAQNLVRKDDISYFDELIKDIFSKKEKHRHFYYIMITDGEMKKQLKSNSLSTKAITSSTKSNNSTSLNTSINSIDSTSEEYFPGHVFVIEKIPCENNNKYMLYQSYINEYDLKGHFDKNSSSMEISENKLKEILTMGTKQIFINSQWNTNISKYWKELTHVDASNFNGYNTDNLKFCYQKIRVESCYKILKNFINYAVSEINKNPNKYNIPVTGDPPLPKEELKNKLLELQTKINNLYKLYNVKSGQ